jgi:2,5-diamino-6-(ribosylamino)-4(3H)-pyrimidinone 5'-phosphate reductase
LSIYGALEFGPAPQDRPYVFLNMVATIDGKTVSGSRDESVVDLGSKTDHLLMDRIEAAADAVMLGAQTIRATPAAWNPKSPMRIAVTRSGNVNYDSMFLSAPNVKAYVAIPRKTSLTPPPGIGVLQAGDEDVDFVELLKILRIELGIKRLLCLGGSETNAQLIRHGLADELFLTIAPKVKLGRDVPTYAGGEPLERAQMPQFSIVEHHVVENEVFLRYRRVVGT